MVFLAAALSSCASEPELPKPAVASGTTSEIVYVDVREIFEWDDGHVENAIHVRLSDIMSGKVSKIPKDKRLAIYCRSGNRSATAVEKLKSLGYSDLYDAGGMVSIP